LVDDVQTGSRYIEVVKAVRSELVIPLIAKSRVAGVLDIESPRGRLPRRAGEVQPAGKPADATGVTGLVGVLSILKSRQTAIL
jgi:hypothetical protein